MWLMREEIWTEKIFKDDADYFLRITYIRFNIQTKDRFSEAIIQQTIIFGQTITYKTIETVKTIYEYSGGLYVNGKITNYVYDRVQK